MNSDKPTHEFECFVIKYQDDLYVWRNQDKTGKFELTGHRNVALQRADRPTQEELEIISEYLGVWFSDLSVVKRTISESLDRVASADGTSFLSEAGLSPEWCKREVQKHIDAGHNLTDVTTLDSDRIRFLCSCGVGLMGDFKRHLKV